MPFEHDWHELGQLIQFDPSKRKPFLQVKHLLKSQVAQEAGQQKPLTKLNGATQDWQELIEEQVEHLVLQAKHWLLAR